MGPPTTPLTERPQVVPSVLRAVAAFLFRDGLFVTSATPVDTNQRAALCGGLVSNQQARSACLSSELHSPRLCRGFFTLRPPTQKERPLLVAWQRPLVRTAEHQRDRGVGVRLVVKSIFLVRTHTAIKFFNAIQFFLCSSTGTQLLVSSLQIISGD